MQKPLSINEVYYKWIKVYTHFLNILSLYTVNYTWFEVDRG